MASRARRTKSDLLQADIRNVARLDRTAGGVWRPWAPVRARARAGRSRRVAPSEEGRVRSSAAGFTLVEILVTVAILGLVTAGLFGTLSTFLMLGSVQRSTANIDQVVRTYSERIESASYVNCASSYPSVTLPSGYSFSAGPTFAYWNGDSPATFGSTCSGDKGVQRISATVREQSSGKTQQLVIAKNSG